MYVCIVCVYRVCVCEIVNVCPRNVLSVWIVYCRGPTLDHVDRGNN